MVMSLLMWSCNSTKNIPYFQDVEQGSEVTLQNVKPITVKPGDKLLIIVNSKDSKLADLFNLSTVSRTVGQEAGYATQQICGYTTNDNGYIDFPILGKIKVEGMTRSEISNTIKNQIIAKNLILDPVVTVEFMNMNISVLGEVSKPGRISIDKDKVTILDALGMAGDLTIYGKRDKVLVMREENGKQKVYTVDLRSGSSIYSSPVYYLQQNDVVYVEPNQMRARQSTVNGNNVVSTSFWISIASLLTSVAVLIFK